METFAPANADGDGLGRRQVALLLVVSVALGVGVLAVDYFLPSSLVRLALMGVAAATVGLVVFSYPQFGLLVAVFYIYAGLNYYFSFPAAYPIVVLVLAATMLRVFRGETLRTTAPSYNWTITIFAVLAVQSMLFSYSLTYSLISFSMFLKSLVLVFLVVQLVKTPRDLERFAMVILVGCIATVLLGIINIQIGLVKDPKMLMDVGWMRFTGTHMDPNTSAAYLITALPLAAYLMRRVPRTRWRVLAAIAIIILVVAVLSTFSRAAMLPLTFVLLAILFRDVRSKKVYAGLVLLAIAIFLVTPSYYWNRLLSVSEFLSGLSNDWSLMLRAKAIVSAWHLFLAHPLTGVGLQNFIVRAPPEMFVRIVAHNSYLEILVGTGIFGLAAYLAVHVAVVGEYLRAMRASWGPECGWMRHLSFYMLISYLSALISAIFLSVPFIYVIWIPLAIGVAAGRLARDTNAETPK